MKKKLSVRVRWIQYIPLAFIILILGLTIFRWTREPFETEHLILSVVATIFTIGFWFPFYWAREASYDSQYLYLTGSHGEEIISLRNIDKILIDKKIEVFYKTWFVRYHTDEGEKGAVRLIMIGQNKKEAFNSTLKSANRSVKYKIEYLYSKWGKRTTPTSL